MHEPTTLRWILGGGLFWVVLLLCLHAWGTAPTVRKEARFTCLCPDSATASGPRSLHTERN